MVLSCFISNNNNTYLLGGTLKTKMADHLIMDGLSHEEYDGAFAFLID